jgi:hypothetical protein
LVITEKSDGTQSVGAIDTEFPSAVSPLFDITGLAAGEKLAGIDVRPKDGQVYGLLVKGTTGQLVKEGAGTGVDRIGVTFPVTGTAFGFEFNPATDRIRVVSDTEENFQLHPGTGVKTANTDLTPAGTVVGAAHTNNREPAPTTSTLFDIDVAGSGDKVMMQGGPEGSPSADGGVLTTVGPTGFDSGNSLGFDIGFSAAGEPGTAIAAFQTAAATAGSLSEVWAVNVNNATTGNTLGKAVKLGTIGDGTLKVVAFALL